MLRASVMVARWAHNPEGRFDSEATQPNVFCYSGRSEKRGGIEQCGPQRESDLVSEVCDKL